nr:hypothetical protein [Ammoniphilus resinae]
MTLFLFVGLLTVFFTLLFKRPLIDTLGENTLVHKLHNANWFQNHWLSGVFLFVMNAALFFLTGLILYGVTYLSIPFIHLLIIILAVIGSIFLWITINQAWQGTNRNRLKMGFVGSSFYGALTLLFAYWLVTLEPSYPDEDCFMDAIGLVLGIIVTTVAFLSCLMITGFAHKKATG